MATNLRRAAWAVGLTLLIAGCTVFGVRTFGVAFPAENGLDGLPVLVTDHSGLVTMVDLVAARPELVEGQVAAVPGKPNALELFWVGGMCDSNVGITIHSGPTLGIEIATTRRAGVCELMGIGRRIVVQFSRPMTPDQVVIAIAP